MNYNELTHEKSGHTVTDIEGGFADSTGNQDDLMNLNLGSEPNDLDGEMPF